MGHSVFRKDSKCKFLYREVGFLFKRRLWRFYTGNLQSQDEMDEDKYKEFLANQQKTPMRVVSDSSSKKCWWMFRGEFYVEDEGYSMIEVAALIMDMMQKKEKKIHRIIARAKQIESDSLPVRQPIPDDVKILVWQRDGGRCVECGSQQNLEYDHIIPLSKGGSNTARNLQLLCEGCNRSKGANLS